MNPLDKYPRIRRALYDVQWLVAGVMGVIGIILAANNGGLDELPKWYNTTTLVLTFIWTYTGITASGNVQEPVKLLPPEEAQPNNGEE